MNWFNKLVNWYFKRDSLPYWCVVLIDCIICYLSGLFVFWQFFRGAATLYNIIPITHTLLLYLVFNVISFRIFQTYSGIIRYSSFVDLQRVALAMGVAFLFVFLVHYPVLFWEDNRWFVPLHTRHIIAIYLVSTVLMWTFRIVVKMIYDTMFENEKAQRTFIYGVKEGGVGLAKHINNQKPQRFKLMGFIANEGDPTPGYLMGKKVYRMDESLAHVIRAKRIRNVLVSPLRNKEFRDDVRLQDLLMNAGVTIYMTKGLQEWNSENAANVVNSLKEISIEDLLPRDPIEIDMKGIECALRGKTVLITGSAGSIGFEMVRQISKFDPAEMILIDQAETPQHDVRLFMRKEFPAISTRTIVASIANRDRMETFFASCHPDYVFHAAAYKHVPMMEDNPSESIQNNIWGTKVIADLSVKYGVKKFVMISTDKAVNPSNVMGCSKRICEIYVQSLDKAEKEGRVKGHTQFVTTRFGNVLGSSGSVIPLFKKQIKAGGPVTVTHPDIIRFFMLIPEACKLVLEAGTQGKGGEIFVFDMGSPVKIADLAKRMIKLSGAENIEIKYTGLRAGEKLYEVVLNDKEKTLPSSNPKIRIAQVRQYDYEDVERQIEEIMQISHSYDDIEIVRKMKQIVPEFKSNNSVYDKLDEDIEQGKKQDK